MLDRTGNGRKEDVLQAFRWILENKRYYGIRVVNISVGTTCRRAEDHRVLIAGVEQLWDAGLVVVAAAGNQGPKAGSVTAPGKQPKDYHSRLQRSAYRTDCHIRQGTYI